MKKTVIFVLVLLLAMIVVPVAALDLSEFSTKNVKNTFSTPIFEKSEEPNAENSDTVKVMAKAQYYDRFRHGIPCRLCCE